MTKIEINPGPQRFKHAVEAGKLQINKSFETMTPEQLDHERRLELLELARSMPLNAGHKLALMALATNSEDDGGFLYTGTLSLCAGVKLDLFSRYVDTLEALGMIEIVKHKNTDGGVLAYRLKIEGWPHNREQVTSYERYARVKPQHC